MAAYLTVEFASVEDLRTQTPHVEQGGVFVPVPTRLPEPFAEVWLQLVAPGVRLSLAARVVHLAPGSGMALAFLDARAARQAFAGLPPATGPATGRAPTVSWAEPSRDAAPRGERAPAPESTTPPRTGAQEPDEGPDEPEEPRDEAARTLYDRIRAMSLSERIHLAQHGDRAARLLLMKDTNKTLHTFLVQNPQITLDEVRVLAGYRQANPEALKRIAENRDWIHNPRIVAALVSNPKTPTAIAIELLDQLPEAELRRIARSDSHPRAVTMAARRKVIGG